MINLIDNFTLFLQDNPFTKNKTKGLIAVSGGVDSVVLLHLFNKLKSEFNFEIGVVHLNHSTREKNSDMDELFVKNLANINNNNFFSKKWNSNTSSNFEELARNARYNFFFEIKKKESYDWIATGHHLDDQAETILMRFIQGNSYRGLKGIPRYQNFLIRPLLDITKNDIILYAKKNSLDFRNDESNNDLKFLRNRLRKNILPKINQINPNFLKSIQNLTNNFNQISNWVDITIDTFKENFSSLDENNNYYVDKDELTKYPIFIQQEIIKSFFSSNSKWRKHIWDRLREFLLFSSTGEYLILDELSKVLKDRKKIFIISNVKKSLEVIFEFKSDGPVSKKIGKYHFNLNQIIHSKKFTSNNSKELIDFDLIKKKSLILRPWENGDKMIPLGMKNFKKISDILIDNKINRFEKKNKYILCSNDKIIWLCGLKLDERFKITSKTKSFAELNWKKNIYD